MDLNNDFRTQRKPQYSLGHTNGWYREQTVHNFEMNNDFLLSYKDRFGDFDISASFGGNNMYREARNVTETAENLAEPNVFRLVNVAGVLSVSNFRSKKSVNSFYGFLNLSWRDMLFLDVTGRNDWSSTLRRATTPISTPRSASASCSTKFSNSMTRRRGSTC